MSMVQCGECRLSLSAVPGPMRALFKGDEKIQLRRVELPVSLS